MSELKRCPFCGSTAIIETFITAMEGVDRYRVRCSKCFCMTDWDNFSVDEAVAAWNGRVDDGNVSQ